MKNLMTILITLLFQLGAHGQATYEGFIDKYPIQLVMQVYSDGVVNAFYVYTNFDQPIKTDGTFKNKTLVLNELDAAEKVKSTLTFNNFTSEAVQLEGIWKDLKTGKQLNIHVKKTFDLDLNPAKVWQKMELVQMNSLKSHYFVVINRKNKDDYQPVVTGLKILEKKTDKVFQEVLNLDCQFWGFTQTSVGDFNFDGHEDFAVFESGSAGPNTSSLYFLFDPNTKKFFKSSFEGTSLEFDPKTKRIFERNQSGAGAYQMTAEYKVVNNKMVLVKKTCLEYDSKKDDYKKVKCD